MHSGRPQAMGMRISILTIRERLGFDFLSVAFFGLLSLKNGIAELAVLIGSVRSFTAAFCEAGCISAVDVPAIGPCAFIIFCSKRSLCT